MYADANANADHSLGHFEQLVCLWFPNASHELLKITHQSASGTCWWWGATWTKQVWLEINKCPPEFLFISLSMRHQWLTFGPADSDHNQQRVLIFLVRLVDPSQHLPRAGDFLHPGQHQPERHQWRGVVHQVHRAVKHEVPAGTWCCLK